MRIGVICPAEIAIRRFLPALNLVPEFEFAGMAIPTIEERFGDHRPDGSVMDKVRQNERAKAEQCIEQYGGRLFEGYAAIVESPCVDALYIPLPPALHSYWAEYALRRGKHVLVEKPATLSMADTRKLVDLARARGLGLHENYMFVFHDQLAVVHDMIRDGVVGDVRLYRIAFGFPKRPAGDFRYDRELGGGALIDAGGYVLKYARRILGPSCRIRYAQMNSQSGYDVDIYGSGALTNEHGDSVQIAFGMDNDYKCELEVWGSTGTLYSNRILTAPAGFTPSVEIRRNGASEKRMLPPDDSFRKSIEFFGRCVNDGQMREKEYAEMLDQAALVDRFRTLAESGCGHEA